MDRLHDSAPLVAEAVYHLKAFVANWVSVIQELLPLTQWCHVATKDNPTDLLSRGINAKDLTHCQLWWKGMASILSCAVAHQDACSQECPSRNKYVMLCH